MYIIVLLLQNHNMYRAKLQFFCYNAFTVGNKSPHKSLILTKNNTKSYTQTQSSCITSTRRPIRRWSYIKKKPSLPKGTTVYSVLSVSELLSNCCVSSNCVSSNCVNRNYSVSVNRSSLLCFVTTRSE